MNKILEYPKCLEITDNMIYEGLTDTALFNIFDEYFYEREMFEKTKYYKELIKYEKNKVTLIYWLMLAKFRYFKLLSSNGYYSPDLITEIDSLLEEVMLHIEKFDDDIKILIKETNLTFSFDKTGIIPYITGSKVAIHTQSLKEALDNIDKIDIPSSKDKERYQLKNNLNSQILFYQSTTMKNIDFDFYKKKKFIRKLLLVNNLRRKSEYKLYEEDLKCFMDKYYDLKISKLYIILSYTPLLAKFLLKSE